jgi:flagellar basal-body rod protein FlgB
MWGLNSENFKLLEKGIGAAELRHQILANNLANINTPNFKRSDVRFSDVFRKYMENDEIEGKRTNPRHFIIGKGKELEEARPEIFQDDKTKVRNDGNNVNMEFETAQIIKNSLYMQTLFTVMNQDLQKMRIAMAKGV